MKNTDSKNNSAKNINMSEIPVHSTATLAKASLAAAVIAGIVLVTTILPAEYKIDPTGIGKSLGLIQLAESTSATTNVPDLMSAASGKDNKENGMDLGRSKLIGNAPSVAEITHARQTSGVRSDTVKIDIPAGRGLEYKLLMDEFVHLEYEWSTDGEALYFDFHGEPMGDKTGYFESFSITTSNQMKGSLTTPFAGSHGWYWKNTSDTSITVTLTTKGDYTIKG